MSAPAEGRSWMTSPLTVPAGTVHWIAHLTRPGAEDPTYPEVLCRRDVFLRDARPAKAPHGKCPGCLTLTAEAESWCITDLQILREIAAPRVLARLIIDPDSMVEDLQKQSRDAGAVSHGSGAGWAWCRDGLRIWRGKCPGAKAVDKHTPDRLLTWDSIRGHATAHSTPEQRWWLAELEGWSRHWWKAGLSPDIDLETGWALIRRQRVAEGQQAAIAEPTWSDATLDGAPVQLTIFDALAAMA